MTKYSDAIGKLKQKIKGLAEQKAAFRRIILSHKFDDQGNRRPETGTLRHTLKLDYDWTVRRFTRANLIAYGLLRGIPYKTIEAKCLEKDYSLPNAVMKALHEVFGEDAELKAEWPLEKVCEYLRAEPDQAVSALEETRVAS